MSVNKVILIGRLGADPEIRYTADGQPVATFRIATNEVWVKNGERQEHTEWHRIVAFGRLAEICGEYLSKGRQVYIEGRIRTRSFEDRDGNRRYVTEIVANDMRMLDGRRDTMESGPSDSFGSPREESLPEPPPDEDLPF
ncbi:single-stranded DNA-binding protein [Thermosulfurimonas dismutans]|uniref:Single-stranded DNA-binding protein n=1 Tax=Thermosulfurimonas dismutans TaxID=999894 RepID=A0A179D468_9BACT|nr:single-stranded DNA-binding protein [Thermosulfurimonas dismutans]OAQ20847.1 Single-stranded DNA-binding protein [Thermosulfurimonas dismutans]